MPQRGDKRNLVKSGKEKSCEINRAYDPEPFFELEPGRSHSRICSGEASCSAAISQRYSLHFRRKNEPIAFAVLEHGVPAPGLRLRRAFKFHTALLQFGICLVDVIAHVRHVHE